MFHAREQILSLTAVSLACAAASSCAPFGDTLTENQCAAQSLIDGGSSGEVGINALTPVGRGNELAQSFRTSSDTTISSVALKLRRQGNPNGVTLELSITQDNAGTPGTSPLTAAAVSSFPLTYDVGTNTGNVGTTSAFYTFNLGGSVTLSKNTTYWLRLEGNYSPSDTTLIFWSGSASASYSSGGAFFETGTPDAFLSLGASYDMVFRLGCT